MVLQGVRAAAAGNKGSRGPTGRGMRPAPLKLPGPRVVAHRSGEARGRSTHLHSSSQRLEWHVPRHGDAHAQRSREHVQIQSSVNRIISMNRTE
jgi:hypothetical protein